MRIPSIVLLTALTLTALALTALALGAVSVSHAEDVHLRSAVGRLTVVEGELPEGPWSNDWSAQRRAVPARVVLDPPAEGYLHVREGELPWTLSQSGLSQVEVVVRVPEGTAATGLLVLPGTDWVTGTRVRFRIDGESAEEVPAAEFTAAKADHHRSLLLRSMPGAAWFRHELSETGGETSILPPELRATQRQLDLDGTIAFFSGGRAIGENLQLDRLIPLPTDDSGAGLPVPLSEIRGVTVREFDWTPHLEGLEVQPDALAGVVPHDQYAVFLPSFDALIAVADAAVENGSLALHMTETRAENARTRERYERQLGVSLDALTRALGPSLVRSVVLTGSDPYLRTGSDVALVFEPADPAALETLLAGRIAAAMGDLAARDEDGAKVWRSEDRVRSAYLARVGDAIVLTNSPAQLSRLRAAAAGTTPALASLDEYRFFRGRYPAGKDGESALVLLTDAAIRKWCGPRWRIAASRRVRALARLADDQVRHAEAILTGGPGTRVPLPKVPDAVDLGDRSLDGDQVRSSIYGSLQFMTPIAELDLERVTAAEAGLYRRWRDGYERNWSNFFDPVALRLKVAEGELEADLTVTPLIGGSDYREFVEVARGGAISADSGDRHPDRWMHIALAIDREAPLFRRSSNWLGAMGGLGQSPFDWLGDSVSVHVEPSSFFDDLRAADDVDQFLQRNGHRIPVLLRAEVASPLRATAFITGVRTFIEQAAPGMTTWETREHAGQAYVRIGPAPSTIAMDPESLEQFALHYALLPDSLTFALDEELLKRFLERRAARAASTGEEGAETEPAARDIPPLLGEHICLQVQLSLPEILMGIEGAGLDYVARLQETCYANLPILNEVRRRWPDRDPVAVYRTLFGTELLCPAGGQYEWDTEWRTMRSTVLGHPGVRVSPEPPPLPFAGWKFGNFGVTFELDGLRARVRLR